MAVLLQINIIPIGKEGASLSDALSEVLKVVEEHNIQYEFGPMSTVLEGELDTFLQAACDQNSSNLGSCKLNDPQQQGLVQQTEQ